MRLLMFDFDGTILDSWASFTGAFAGACREHGLGQFESPEAFLQLFDGSLVEQMLAGGVDPDVMDAFLATLGAKNVVAQAGSDLFDGMASALGQLAQSHTVAVVTSNHTDPVASLLTDRGLGFIDRIVGSEVEPSKEKKIRRMATETGAADYVYIGDTCGDMVEARRAGAISVAVTWGWHSRDRLAAVAPDHLVDTPEQLVTLLLE